MCICVHSLLDGAVIAREQRSARLVVDHGLLDIPLDRVLLFTAAAVGGWTVVALLREAHRLGLWRLLLRLLSSGRRYSHDLDVVEDAALFVAVSAAKVHFLGIPGRACSSYSRPGPNGRFRAGLTALRL